MHLLRTEIERQQCGNRANGSFWPFSSYDEVSFLLLPKDRTGP
jgi:hypothetical protein